MSSSELPRSPREQSCVWVSAGVVSYHICTRDFHCDECPLHAALSSHELRRAAAEPPWPRDRHYTKQHLWVRQLSDHEAHIGLTALAAQVLNPVALWEPGEGQQVAAGTCIVTAETRGGPVDLALPFPVKEVSLSNRIAIDPVWPLADPWDSGFLATIEITDWDKIAHACLSLHDAGPFISHVHQRVNDELTSAGYTQKPETRAADGGLPIEGLAAAIGLARYRLLLAEVFGLHPED